MNSEDKLENPPAELLEEKPSRSKTKIILMSSLGVLLLLVVATSVKLIFEGADGFIDRDSKATEEAKPPPTATEIIAMEFSGKIETAPVKPEELAEPAPGAIPSASDHESREIDEVVASAPTEKPKDEKKMDRKPTATEKIKDKPNHALAFDKSGSKVSKNLDQKKVMQMLAKKLDKSCSPKLPDKTKSLKAQISLSKTGSIANIKVTPSAVEAELAKCMRKKLGDDKALKPKNKAVAQITVQFKIK